MIRQIIDLKISKFHNFKNPKIKFSFILLVDFIVTCYSLYRYSGELTEAGTYIDDLASTLWKNVSILL